MFNFALDFKWRRGVKKGGAVGAEGRQHATLRHWACDEHTYLVPTSCHPAHNIRNIPYSIGHTIYRIASEKHKYDLSKANYTDYLMARGYSSEVIHESFKKLETNDRMSYLNLK